MIKYYAFAKVVELKSISKAAAALGYSQPGLSHILNAFETELGFPILIRKNRNIEPTHNGLKVLDYCKQLIEVEHNLHAAVSDINNNILTGTIRIGAPNSMLIGFVSDLIGVFTSKYPSAEINVHESTLADVYKGLNECIIDVGFITENISDSCKFYPLFEDEICIALNKNHDLAQYDKISFDMLEDYEFIMQLKGWDDIASLVVNRLPFKPKVKYYSASDVASLAMVANNLGVYILSALQAPLLPENVTIRTFSENVTRKIGIGVKSIKSITSSQKEFIEIAEQYAKEKFNSAI